MQRQAPLYMRASLTAPATLVLDPNALWPDGSVSLAQWSPSRDGRLLAYGLSEGGADWRDGQDTGHRHRQAISPTSVRWVRFSDISWTADRKGFFYSRYPEPPQGKVLEAALANQALYYHRIGTPQSEDRLIYARKDLPTWFVYGSVTEDGRYLLIYLSKGSDNNNRLYYADLAIPASRPSAAPIKPLFEEDDAEFSPFGSVGQSPVSAGPIATLPTGKCGGRL